MNNMNKTTKIFLTLIVTLFFTVNISQAKEIKTSVTDGKGIWINIWNYPSNPDSYCKYMKSKGIDTIYLQVFRSNTPAIYSREKLDKVLLAAHKNGIKVVGWGYVFLKNPIEDAKKYLVAINYKSKDGESLDGMAADIEEVTNPKVIDTFARYVRSHVKNDYPMIAITFSPMFKRADPKKYAWKTIANNFDIIAPMTYWHALKDKQSQKGAYDFTAETVSRIKEYTGKSDIKIHIIGDGQKTSSSEIVGFLKAANDHKVNAGVSLYPMHVPKKHQIDTLAEFKMN
jgi:hypothetical protein